MLHKSRNQLLSFLPKSEINLNSQHCSPPRKKKAGHTQSQNIISTNPYVKTTRFFN